MKKAIKVMVSDILESLTVTAVWSAIAVSVVSICYAIGWVSQGFSADGVVSKLLVVIGAVEIVAIIITSIFMWFESASKRGEK